MKGSLDIQSNASMALADQAEAEEGANNSKAMTPLRVKQAMAAGEPLPLMSVSGQISGYMYPGHIGAGAHNSVGFDGVEPGATGTMTITINDVTTYSFVFSPDEPPELGDAFWISTAGGGPETIAEAAAGVINSNVSEVQSYNGGTWAYIIGYHVGAANSITTAGVLDGAVFQGRSMGADEEGPTGDVPSCILRTATNGRKLRLLRAFVSSAAEAAVEIGWYDGSFYQIMERTTTGGGTIEFIPTSDDEVSRLMLVEPADDASLMARFAGGVPHDPTPWNFVALVEER